ncbi:DUF1963 domain-containing protein [Sphingobacterium chuzhouense]|uniref:DUF1963 domain-containing protein n=1 Tax=Sphingobacterium chuzhouense TaxID=1742264 RepID=A0ABR7XP64_9SPHI|nr:DUF1963 domain-containing protein [Sphingobacterium chuzhouense]MBD1420961.1 DUF1963 domain-containing protein [Sphingobacterium chuzhouense]
MCYFIIDGENYLIDAQESQWSIGKMSHTLVTDITVESTNIERDKQKLLLSEYNDDGRIKIHIEASSIFNWGIPTGSFNYHEDKDADTFTYFRKDGLEFSLDFFGSVTYESGSVRIQGELKPPYDKKPSFNVDVSIQFDPALLDWRHYRFKSLAETSGADPHQVCLLEITNPSFRDLPSEIFDFTNLEYLSIVNKTNYWNDIKLPLENLTEQFGSLKMLKGLSVNKASIKQLPVSFAELALLENLNLSLCEIQELPESIWNLPKLQYMILMGNQLTTIPDEIQLPALLTLNIEKSHLTTLPISLLKQPNLRTIKASGNPFEYLPESFGFFKGLELTMPEKKRLLDTSYKGADGKGTIKWDDTVYEAVHDKTLIAPVEDIIKENKLGKYKKALLSLIKRTVGFNQTEHEDYSEIGNHRFGGRPDLPQDIIFPTFHFHGKEKKKQFHYEFIAQINCEQIAHLQDYLPRTGSLFFFFKSIHFFGFDNNDLAKVIYIEDNSTLASGKRFKLQEEDFFELFDGEYAPYKAEAFVSVSVPSFYAHHQNTYLFEGKAKSLADKEDLLEDLYETYEEPVRFLKEFDHAVNSYGFTQHESPELQAALSLKGNPQDWIILLQVKSRGDFQWGDAGDLFFVIHKSDLTKKDFSNVFITMESS